MITPEEITIHTLPYTEGDTPTYEALQALPPIATAADGIDKAVGVILAVPTENDLYVAFRHKQKSVDFVVPSSSLTVISLVSYWHAAMAMLNESAGYGTEYPDANGLVYPTE